MPNSLYTRAARRGVTLSGYPPAIYLGCDSYGSARSPNLQSGGRLPRRWVIAADSVPGAFLRFASDFVTQIGVSTDRPATCCSQTAAASTHNQA